MFISKTGLYLSLLVVPCSGSSSFWKSVRRTGINSLNVWQNSAVKPSSPRLFFDGKLFISDSIWFLFSFLVCSVLVDCMLLGNHQMILSCLPKQHLITYSMDYLPELATISLSISLLPHWALLSLSFMFYFHLLL